MQRLPPCGFLLCDGPELAVLVAWTRAVVVDRRVMACANGLGEADN